MTRSVWETGPGSRSRFNPRCHLVQDTFICSHLVASASVGAKSFSPASHAKIGARTKVIRRRRRKKSCFIRAEMYYLPIQWYIRVSENLTVGVEVG